MLGIIIQALLNDLTLSSLVNIVRPMKLEDGDVNPAITVYRSDVETDYVFNGESGLKKLSVTMNLWVDSLLESESIVREIKRVMYALRGLHDTTKIYSVFVSRELDNYHFDDKEYQTNLVFIITYKEG